MDCFVIGYQSNVVHIVHRLQLLLRLLMFIITACYIFLRLETCTLSLMALYLMLRLQRNRNNKYYGFWILRFEQLAYELL